MTFSRGTPWDISIELDQVEHGSLILLPLGVEDAVGVYPEWAPELARHLRIGDVSIAWATQRRAYTHAFSADVDTVVQIALLLAEPITQSALATLMDFLRSLTSPKGSQEIRVRLATEVDRANGKVTDFSELTIPAGAPIDAVALLEAFNAARVSGIKAALDRD